MTLTESVLEDIRSHGARAYPEEACGFLLGAVTGGGNRIVAARAVENRRSDDRTHRYQLTAADYRDADEAAQREGVDVVGTYHSHPDHPARPSETDLQEATFPGFSYAIVSVRDGDPDELTAWTLAPDRSEFEREEIVVHSREAV